MLDEQTGARTAHAALLRLLRIGQIITLAPARPDAGPLKLVNLLGPARPARHPMPCVILCGTSVAVSPDLDVWRAPSPQPVCQGTCHSVGMGFGPSPNSAAFIAS